MFLRSNRPWSGALAAAATLMVCGAAHATLFSFASDINHLTPTFAGTAGVNGSFNITDFSRPNTFNLVIDDNNGPLPSVTIPVEFHASLTASNGQSTLTSGTTYQHTYRTTGTFGFYNRTTGNLLMQVTVGATGGTLTVTGTQNGWSSAGAILGANAGGDVMYTVTSDMIAAMGGASVAGQYGLAPGNSPITSPDTFGFTLTSLGLTAGGLVPLNATTHAPTGAWRAEGSYSGNSTIPSPGAMAMVGLGGLIASRRRR